MCKGRKLHFVSFVKKLIFWIYYCIWDHFHSILSTLFTPGLLASLHCLGKWLYFHDKTTLFENFALDSLVTTLHNRMQSLSKVT